MHSFRNYLLIVVLLQLILVSCAARVTNVFEADGSAAGVFANADANPPASGLQLPADGVQPWESLDADAHVISAGDRNANSVNASTDFTPGVQRFMDSGDIASNDEALRLNGTDDSGSSYAMYRVSLQAEQPGVVSIDANLLGNGSEYYVGVSNYGASRWQWNGPFSDNHVRLQVVTDSSGDYTSTLGNTFVSVLVDANSSIDIVGVGINQFELGDAVAPATPLGLSLTPVNGGIELSWSPVLEPDLAGYRIYYSSNSFANQNSAGVQQIPYLEGSTQHLLSELKATTFIAIAAMDFAGNESALSSLESASPLSAVPGSVTLTGSAASGGINEAITLTASGAELYDWDLNGDGVFEVADDNTGSQQADTSATGIIRPAVRGHDGSGEAVALGGLSLIITGNTRPVASATADPQSGPVPLEVTFTGDAEDSEDAPEDLTYAWDFDGDGIYETGTDTLTPTPQNYSVPGTVTAKFRVTDSEAAWDVDSVAITVGDGLGGWPTAYLQTDPQGTEPGVPLSFDASASVDPGGAITNYQWDTDFDGNYNESDNGEDALEGLAMIQLFWPEAGEYPVAVRVSDADGHSTIAQAAATVHGWRITNLQTPEDVVYNSVLLIVEGRPAVFYNDNDSDALLFMRALNEAGSAWPAPVTVSMDAYIRGNHSAMIAGGVPILAISGPSGGLRLARAEDALGSSWAVPLSLDDTSGSTYTTCMASVAGNPAIAYQDDTAKRLRYIRADDAAGESWDSPVNVDSANEPGRWCSMAVVNGYPAISYILYNGLDLAYVRATDATGSSWGGRKILDTTNNTGYFTSLCVVKGAPAVAYQNSTNTELLYIRASDANGDSWGSKVLVDTVGSTGYYPSLGIFDGLPLICYRSSARNTAVLSAANDLQGSSWAESFEIDLENNMGQELSMVNFNGRVAISYYDQSSQSNGDIRFAIRY